MGGFTRKSVLHATAGNNRSQSLTGDYGPVRRPQRGGIPEYHDHHQLTQDGKSPELPPFLRLERNGMCLLLLRTLHGVVDKVHLLFEFLHRADQIIHLST
jgi:hypothetical protein